MKYSLTLDWNTLKLLLVPDHSKHTPPFVRLLRTHYRWENCERVTAIRELATSETRFANQPGGGFGGENEVLETRITKTACNPKRKCCLLRSSNSFINTAGANTLTTHYMIADRGFPSTHGGDDSTATFQLGGQNTKCSTAAVFTKQASMYFTRTMVLPISHQRTSTCTREVVHKH